MDVGDHLTRIGNEAELLARAAAAGPLDARVPGCPAWDVEALVLHTGNVHRWAGRIVRGRLQERPSREPQRPAEGVDLLAWFREGATELVAALGSVSPGESFWQWAPAPTTQMFWARRQANETSMHRWDAQSAHGEADGFATDVAVDALDEWLMIIERNARIPTGGGRTLHLHATDGDGEWVVSLGDAVSVERGHARADCAVRASASDLYLLAMNRRGAEGLEVFGDTGVLDAWRENVSF